MCQRALCCRQTPRIDQVPPLGHSNTTRRSTLQLTIGTLIASVLPETRKVFTIHHTDCTRDDVRVMLVDRSTETLASSAQTRLPKDGISPSSRHFASTARTLKVVKTIHENDRQRYRSGSERKTISQDVQLLGSYFCLISCNLSYL